jgi:hypothetical protein
MTQPGPLRRPRLGPLPISLALLLLAAGCARLAERSVVRLTLAAPAPALEEGADEAALLSAVAWVLVQRLGLPLSPNVFAYFYSSREAFELGLVTDAGLETWVARDQARFAWGIGNDQGIFLRQDRLAAAPLAVRVGLVAHELTHVSQYELAGGRRGRSEQWLREGLADWVRYQVLQHFGLRSYAESKRRILEEIRRQGSLDRFPELTTLGANREWNAARAQYGAVGTYRQAFLAVDWLVERRGHDAIIDYFRRFGSVDEREGNFQAAFGVPPGEFALEFRSRLSTLLRTESGAALDRGAMAARPT